MKFIFFGTGKYYQKRKEKIPHNINIEAFLDNNSELQGKYLDGVRILSPNQINQLSYDKIVLMSISIKEMKAQLMELGVCEEDIWYWEQFISETNRGILRFFCGNSSTGEYKKKVLIISVELNYNGGTIAAVYAAETLQNRKYKVVLAAPGGNPKFIDEIVKKGINTVICPALIYPQKEELFWINEFDVVIVNVFSMALCVSMVSKIKPVMWWIHEPKEFYERDLDKFKAYINEKLFERVNIYGVSDIAKRNFNLYFPCVIKETLAYGIPDLNKRNNVKRKSKGIKIAIIGAVCSLKAQDIFIRAIQLLKDEEKSNLEAWIIGRMGEDNYCNEIRKLVSMEESLFKIWGELTRTEIQNMYDEIDIVICSSLEETMSIVITESMMYGKISIVSDCTGIAKYIKDRENGLICRTGDVFDLSEKIKWVINNQEKAVSISKKARQTYNRLFSMEKFGDSLEKVLQDTISLYNRSTKNDS